MCAHTLSFCHASAGMRRHCCPVVLTNHVVWGEKPASALSWDESRIFEFGMVGSIQAFWRIFSALLPVSQLADGANYHFFRSSIAPKWEDPENENGGRWRIFTKTNAFADECWKLLLLSFIGELLDVGGDHVCGISCSRRRSYGFRFDVWIRGDLDAAEILGVAKRAGLICSMDKNKPSDLQFFFRAHEETKGSNKRRSCKSVLDKKSLSWTDVHDSFTQDDIVGLPRITFDPQWKPDQVV